MKTVNFFETPETSEDHTKNTSDFDPLIHVVIMGIEAKSVQLSLNLLLIIVDIVDYVITVNDRWSDMVRIIIRSAQLLG